MKTYRLALIGFGNVNQGLVEILKENSAFLADHYGISFSIIGICDLYHGSIYDPKGIRIEDLYEAIRQGGSLESVTVPKRGWDVNTLVMDPNVDIVVEATYTDLKTGQPATNYIRRALESGKHVVTSNKGPIALHYHELAALAHDRKLFLGVEGTVMSGTPSIRLGMDVLKAARLKKVEGILNGTTNYILTKMEQGAGYAEVLAEAQRLGYAEADPTGDVEGFDTAGKIAILSSLLFDQQIGMESIDRKGITQLTSADINEAKHAGECWKLIGSLEFTEGKLKASVKPIRLPLSHPLARVSGATNAICYDTAILGQITLVGPGAGRQATGFALLSDLLTTHTF